MKRKLLLLLLLVFNLVFTSCSYEKMVRIEMINEFMNEIEDTYEDITHIRVTYIADTVIFNIHIDKEINDFAEDDLYMDLKNFLNDNETQDEIDTYYSEKLRKGNMNKGYPILRILLTSLNEKYAKRYYVLDRSDDVKEWTGPHYDIGVY